MWENQNDIHQQDVQRAHLLKLNYGDDMIPQQQQLWANDFNQGRSSPSILSNSDYSQPPTPTISGMISPELNNDNLLLQLQSRQRQILMQQEQILMLREQMMRQPQQNTGVPLKSSSSSTTASSVPSHVYPPMNPSLSTPTSPARRMHDSESHVPIIRSPLLEEFRNNKNKKFALKVRTKKFVKVFLINYSFRTLLTMLSSLAATNTVVDSSNKS